jgi:hypothetical protein
MSNHEGRLRRVLRSVATRLRPHHDEERRAGSPAPAGRAESPSYVARPAKRESDIPLDRVEGAYTPTQTSQKAGFRADGRDRQADQELTPADRDDRWNDEDRFTNKSGDPRIGTHGRAYEPGESRR